MNRTYKGSIELLRDFWESRSASFEKDYGIRRKGIAKLARETAGSIDRESCNVNIEGEKELSEKLRHVGLSVQKVMFIRFIAGFRLKRYLKSRNEIQRLKEVNSNLWKHLEKCENSRKIEREFILLISRKRQNHVLSTGP